jgi:HSP20 family protein
MNRGFLKMSSLIPWLSKSPNKVSESSVSEFKREIDTLFDNFFGAKWPLAFSAESKGFVPAFDVRETEDDLLVSAELPGVEASDIEVNLVGSVLVIKGEKKEEKEEKGENRHTVERTYGSFTRSVTIPCDVIQDKIEANFRNGVLELKLPKAQHEKKTARKIEVKQS